MRQETTLESSKQQELPESAATQPVTYVDKDGKPITFDRYRVLLTQFTNVDDDWKVNGLGQRERRTKI